VGVVELPVCPAVPRWSPVGPVLQLGDDLFDDGVVAVGGLGGQHRLGAVGEHGVVAVDDERFGLPGRHRLRVEAAGSIRAAGADSWAARTAAMSAMALVTLTPIPGSVTTAT
jgi:hypothetical protein